MITKVIKPSLIAFMLLSGASAALYAVDTDTDSDGIVDSIDLDDDNDGILDTIEVSCTEDGVVDLSAYDGQEPADEIINNNDIMIGSSKVTLTYTMFGDANLVPMISRIPTMKGRWEFTLDTLLEILQIIITVWKYGLTSLSPLRG